VIFGFFKFDCRVLCLRVLFEVETLILLILLQMLFRLSHLVNIVRIETLTIIVVIFVALFHVVRNFPFGGPQLLSLSLVLVRTKLLKDSSLLWNDAPIVDIKQVFHYLLALCFSLWYFVSGLD